MVSAIDKLVEAHESIVKSEPDPEDDISKILSTCKPARSSNNSVRFHSYHVADSVNSRNRKVLKT